MLSSNSEIYSQNIQSEFGAICSDCGHNVSTKPLLTDILNRQQILFMQYEMQKKGKTMGMTENRLFKIQQGKLYQVDSDGEEKLLPEPVELVMIKRGPQRWEAKYESCKALIILKFKERNDITVFFKEIIEWREIGMYLKAEIQKRKGVRFQNLAQQYTHRVAEELADKISNMKTESADIKKLRVRAKINDIFKFHLSDRAFIKDVMTTWKSKALFANKEMAIKIGLVSLRSTLLLTGAVKLWTKGMVMGQLALSNGSAMTSEPQNYYYPFRGEFSEETIRVRSQDEFQFEIQCQRFTFKSERFMALDLNRLAHRSSIIQINLYSREGSGILTFSLQVEGIKPEISLKEITPQHFRVIDELYVPEDLQFELPSIYNFYFNTLTAVEQRRPYYASFYRFKQLFQMLKIQDLIQKFYLISPFKDFVEVEFRGSAVYSYFANQYDKELYYDVQKIIWKHQKPQFRRLMSALKSLDSNQKFNFTDPFLFLVEKMQEISQTQSVSRWRSSLFAKDVMGIQAVAFFLALSVSKTFSSIFFYQEFPNKKALPFNSLLLMYVIQKHLPQIHLKCLKIDLNLQALFGQHLVNLFSALLPGDSFTRVLLLLLEQQEKDPQDMYYKPLIAVFLTLLEMVNQYQCSYLSAQHFVITLEQISKGVDDKLAFFRRVSQWSERVSVEQSSKQFIEMADEMTEFYLSNVYVGDFGQISRQIYQQFMSYHFKNELDLRKIFIVIDKIELWQRTPEINFTIFQSATKVYEHNFKGVDLSKLDHFIELKLTKLEELNLIFNNGKYSFSCRLDPREIPSNLYFHMVKPLILTYHMSPESSRHIFMQVYIKDSCENDSLENPIPNKYRQLLLQKGVDKEDILFCKKFTKSFRMPENNFNLLYSKLGWFNCHYLAPDDRLLQVQFLGPKQAGEEDLHSRIAKLNRYTRALFGKAILPKPSNQPRKLSLDIIKENTLTSYEPHSVSCQFTEMNVYSSASRLLCYCLDNFSMATSISFIQFYQQMGEKLPLINYLSYQPRQFYYLPSFTFQVYCPTSTTTVLISQKGAPFRTAFASEEIKKIEEEASTIPKLPLQIQFGYVSTRMYFDEFLFLLRLNILKKVSQAGDRKGKMKRWPNSLVASVVNIPNYELRCFYEVMCETKQLLQFEFKEAVNRLLEPLEYVQWALIKDRWRRVHCLSLLKATDKVYYYVVESFQRKKHIINQENLIKVSQQPFREIVLSDDIADSMEVISYELTKMFNQ